MSKEIHNILLRPDAAALMIVDHQLSFGSCFDKNSVQAAEMGLLRLVNLATDKNIPVFTSLVEINQICPKMSLKLEQTIPDINRFKRSGSNPWDDSDFTKSVQSTDRRCLLIAGLSAETSLSYTALCALEQGFDVYVIKDACLGHSSESIATTFERLTQAGVVVVTWRQVVLEWHQGNLEFGLLRRTLKSPRKSRAILNPE